MKRASSAGQALVEFAVTVGVLLALFLGVVQVALWLHARTVLTGACQEGARAAAVEAVPPGTGEKRARSLVAAGLGSQAQHVIIHAEPGPAQITLDCRGTLRPVVPWPGEGIQVHTRSVMRKEMLSP